MRHAARYVLLVLAACSQHETADDTSRVLETMSTQTIEPALDALDDRADALVAQANAYAQDSEQRVATGSAWRACRHAWMRLAPFRVGAFSDDETASAIDFAPASTDAIERAVQAGRMSDGAVETLGGNARGFFALEYLLFASDAPNAQDDAHRVFAAALAKHVARRAHLLRGAWSSSRLGAPRDALGAYVNATMNALEALTDDALGAPLGETGKGRLDPSAILTQRSDNAREDAQAMCEGITLAFHGGLGALVTAKNPALAARVNGELDDAAARLGAIPTPFVNALMHDTNAVRAAWTAVKTVRTTFAVDVASTLGITLTFPRGDAD